MWNPIQPERDMADLAPRTHISHPLSTYDPFETKNMLAQVSLYHWCMSDEFANGVAIADLHAYLFGRNSPVTMRQMGRTVMQTTIYDPRKLKAATLSNPKACKIYVFNDRRDFQYGLEWMLSMWLWNVEYTLRETYNPEKLQESKQNMLEIFDEFPSLSVQELENLYLEPIRQAQFKDVDGFLMKGPHWPTLWAKHGWENEAVVVAPIARFGKAPMSLLGKDGTRQKGLKSLLGGKDGRKKVTLVPGVGPVED